MKKYFDINVYDAAKERLRYIFNEFDNVLVAFSTGKDSGVMMEVAYQVATEMNMVNKMAIYYQDYEAIYQGSTDYAMRVFNERFLDIKRKYWLCMPIKAACSVTMMQDGWIPWDEDKREIWVREYPNSNSLFTIHNYPYPFKKGRKGFDFRIDFSKDFAKEFGKTAVLVGIRADESLSRLSIISSNQRVNMYKNIPHSTKVCNNVYTFYPIYDWRTTDIWVANAKYNFDYNKTYDLYYLSGLSIDEMRIASPFHASGQAHLKLYKVIDPNNWGKMISRVNGVNFAGIYGGTTAMGWKNITKPAHFTWAEYANFLLGTLPDNIRKKYEQKIEKSKWHWSVQGGARTPEFIEQLEKEGWKIRKTEKSSDSCKVNTHKKIVYIDEMADDTNIDDFKKAPTWKRVCIAILKNDTQCLYMGFSRTKSDNEKRKKALIMYKNL